MDKKFLKISTILLIVGISSVVTSLLIKEYVPEVRAESDDKLITFLSWTMLFLFLGGFEILFISIAFVIRTFWKSNISFALILGVILVTSWVFSFDHTLDSMAQILWMML